MILGHRFGFHHQNITCGNANSSQNLTNIKCLFKRKGISIFLSENKYLSAKNRVFIFSRSIFSEQSKWEQTKISFLPRILSE